MSARLMPTLTLARQETYMIQRFGQVQPAVGRVKRSFLRNAMPERERAQGSSGRLS
jgi:hypothetical protein